MTRDFGLLRTRKFLLSTYLQPRERPIAPHTIPIAFQEPLVPHIQIMFRNQYDQARRPKTFPQKLITSSFAFPGHPHVESARTSSPNRMYVFNRVRERSDPRNKTCFLGRCDGSCEAGGGNCRLQGVLTFTLPKIPIQYLVFAD